MVNSLDGRSRYCSSGKVAGHSTDPVVLGEPVRNWVLVHARRASESATGERSTGAISCRRSCFLAPSGQTKTPCARSSTARSPLCCLRWSSSFSSIVGGSPQSEAACAARRTKCSGNRNVSRREDLGAWNLRVVPSSSASRRRNAQDAHGRPLEIENPASARQSWRRT